MPTECPALSPDDCWGSSSERMCVTEANVYSATVAKHLLYPQCGAGPLHGHHLRPPHGVTWGGPLMSFLHQETREQHQGLSGCPGSHAHMTHSCSRPSLSLPRKHCAQRGKVAAQGTYQGEWAIMGLQKPGPCAPKPGFAHYPSFYIRASWER